LITVSVALACVSETVNRPLTGPVSLPSRVVAIDSVGSEERRVGREGEFGAPIAICGAPLVIGLNVTLTVSVPSTRVSSSTATVIVADNWFFGIVRLPLNGLKSPPLTAVPLTV